MGPRANEAEGTDHPVVASHGSSPNAGAGVGALRSGCDAPAAGVVTVAIGSCRAGLMTTDRDAAGGVPLPTSGVPPPDFGGVD